MDEMRELIDEAAVERAFAVLAVAGPLVGLAGGAVWSSLNKAAPRIGLLRGLAIGLLGPLLLGLWRLFVGWSATNPRRTRRTTTLVWSGSTCCC